MNNGPANSNMNDTLLLRIIGILLGISISLGAYLFNQVNTKLDQVLNITNKIQVRSATNDEMIRRHEIHLDDLEKRVRKVEQKVDR